MKLINNFSEMHKTMNITRTIGLLFALLLFSSAVWAYSSSVGDWIVYGNITAGSVNGIINAASYATIQDAINASVAGDTILIPHGTYNIMTRTGISGTAYIYIEKPNITIYGEGAKLNINYNTDDSLQRGFEIGADNVKVYGLELNGTGLCGSLSCYGFRIYGGNNTILDGINVTNVKGFAVTIESVSGKSGDNTLLQNCHINGVGTADVLGGGSLTKNTTVRKCTITQDLSLGVYEAALDQVNLSNALYEDNIIIGDALIGSEEGASSDITFRGNKIYPARNTIKNRVDVSTSLVLNERFTFDNNYIYNGRFGEMYGSNFTFINNRVINQVGNNDLYTNNSKYIFNQFTGPTNSYYSSNEFYFNEFSTYSDNGDNIELQNGHVSPYNHGKSISCITKNAYGVGDICTNSTTGTHYTYNGSEWTVDNLQTQIEEEFIGDGSRTYFNTTYSPIVTNSTKVTNATQRVRYGAGAGKYTANSTGVIFGTAPINGESILVDYVI